MNAGRQRHPPNPVIEFTRISPVHHVRLELPFEPGGPISGHRSIVDSNGDLPATSALDPYPPKWWGQAKNSRALYLYPFSELLRFTPLLFLSAIPWILVAVTLFDAVRHTGTEWDQTDQDQLLWTIVILSGGFIPLVGPVAYLLVARPRLRAVSSRRSLSGMPAESSSVGTEQR